MNTPTHVISKSYVPRLIIKCGLFFAAGLLLTGILLYYSMHQPLGPSYKEGFSRLAQLKHEMLFKSIITYFTFTSLIITGVFFITVRYSHRVVGPLVGLKRVINQITQGDLSQKATIRKKDDIEPMAKALNDSIDSLRKRIILAQKNTTELKTIIDQPSSMDKTNKLSQQAKEIKGIMGYFKL